MILSALTFRPKGLFSFLCENTVATFVLVSVHCTICSNAHNGNTNMLITAASLFIISVEVELIVTNNSCTFTH